MANEYTPTVWRTGDVITAEKLNKIEEGIANAEAGGESDLTTAILSLNNQSSVPVELHCPLAMEGEDGDPSLADHTYVLLPTNTAELNVILYKGACTLYVGEAPVAEITGDIIGNYGNYLITGNASISFWNSNND